MKILGLVGGISWISTIDYYKYINQRVNARLGGNDFAECMIYSLNYGEMIRNNEAKDFDKNFRIILKAGFVGYDRFIAVVSCKKRGSGSHQGWPGSSLRHTGQGFSRRADDGLCAGAARR